MRRVVASLAVGAWLCGAVTGSAQDSGKLALLIPELFGPGGLKVDSQARLPDGSTHSAHFNSAFQAEFTQFNIALASQLAAVPLPTPASGFTYTFDSALGVFQRSTQSFGPILTERAETIGKKKVTFGVTYQHFGFDSLEGLSLGSVPAVFTHDDSQLGGGPLRRRHHDERHRRERRPERRLPVLRPREPARHLGRGPLRHRRPRRAVGGPGAAGRDRGRARPRTSTTTARAASAASRPTRARATPAGSATSSSASRATPSTTTPSPWRSASTAASPPATRRTCSASAPSASSRSPSLSFSQGRVAPHLNVAYLWNGESVLAGDVATGHKEDMPDQVQYAVGADIGVTKRLTLAFDFLGTYVIDSPRLIRETFTAANGQSFPQIGFVTESYNLASGAAGLKFNPVGRLLIDFNVLFKLDSAGLRDDVTPLFGIEYAF